MEADKKFEKDFEYFIGDWHWDKESHKFAREMGLFMYGFFEYLRSQNLSEETQRRHERNCQLIGKFIADYGNYSQFSPEILTGEPEYVREFKRKVWDSDYMVQSYKTTWRKLAKYGKLQMKQKP